MSIFTRYVGNGGGGGGSGTVTSVDMTVPSFLSVTGNPITTSGTFMLALSGTALPITSGGTGQVTANAALNALLPSQTGITPGYVLSTNGTNTSWVSSGGGGSFLPLSGGTMTGPALSTSGGWSAPLSTSAGNYLTGPANFTFGNDTQTGLLDIVTSFGTPYGLTATWTAASTVAIAAAPYGFFMSSANASNGATYTHNGFTYTVASGISAGQALLMTGTGVPLASGTLTKASGTGDATITFTSSTSYYYFYAGQGLAAGSGGNQVTGVIQSVATVAGVPTLTMATPPTGAGTGVTLTVMFPQVTMAVQGYQTMRWQSPAPNPFLNSYGSISTLVNTIYPDSAMFSGGAAGTGASVNAYFSGASLGLPPTLAASNAIGGANVYSYGPNRTYGHGFIDTIWVNSINTNVSPTTQQDNQVRRLVIIGDTVASSPGNYGIGFNSNPSGGYREIYFKGADTFANQVEFLSAKKTVEATSSHGFTTTVCAGDNSSGSLAASNLLLRGGVNAGGTSATTNTGNTILQPGYNNGFGSVLIQNYNGANTVMSCGNTDTSPSFPGGLQNNSAQTTLTGSAGTAVCSQPDLGSSYKKVICYLNGYTDTSTQTYTFPTAFTHPPVAVVTAAGVTATITSTTVTFTSVTVTGWVILEGF
jgi:hypothetical protein